MSLLINNDLIWVSIPKCASMSIERALLDSDLNITPHSSITHIVEESKLHSHIKKSELFKDFGIRPTVGISRDWMDSWLSALEFIWQRLLLNQYSPIIQW